MKKSNKILFLNILSTVLTYGITVFTAPVFSRLLGTSGYGVTSVYSTWVNIVAIAFTLSTFGTIVNARVEYPEEDQPKYQSSIMLLSLLVFACCGVLVLLFAGPIGQLLRLNKLLLCLILFHGFGCFCLNFLNSKFVYEFKAGKNFVLSMVIMLTTVALSLLLVFLFPEGQKHYGRILGMGGIYGLAGVLICVYILWKGKTGYNREYWKLCLSLSIPVVVYSLSDVVLGQSDRVMLQSMMGEAQAGLYSLAFNFGSIMFTIFGALNKSWVPFFFDDMKQGRRDALKNQARNFLELFTVLAVGFVLLAPEVYHVFASKDFWSGTNLIPIFVSSYYLNFLCTFPVNYEYYRKKTKVVAIVTISSALLNVLLNYLLIQRMGATGAALATALSHSVQFGLHFGYCRFLLGKGDYPFGLRMWVKYLVVYGGFVALVLLTPSGWLLRWSVGAAIGLWELWRIRKRKVLI